MVSSAAARAYFVHFIGRRGGEGGVHAGPALVLGRLRAHVGGRLGSLFARHRVACLILVGLVGFLADKLVRLVELSLLEHLGERRQVPAGDGTPARAGDGVPPADVRGERCRVGVSPVLLRVYEPGVEEAIGPGQFIVPLLLLVGRFGRRTKTLLEDLQERLHLLVGKHATVRGGDDAVLLKPVHELDGGRRALEVSDP